jgi:hypothetical protein
MLLLTSYCKLKNDNISSGGCISYLWGLLNAFSSLTILSLISISVPGPAQQLNRYIIGFSQLDILPSELIYEKTLTFPDENDEALNTYFDQIGFSSSFAVKNMGSTFIFMIV